VGVGEEGTGSTNHNSSMEMEKEMAHVMEVKESEGSYVTPLILD
jgi:hypothetical protein